MRIRVIDLETTGLLPADGVVEIAAVDLIDGEVGSVASRLCHPGVPIPPALSAIHHIIDEDVADCPAWKSVLPLFADDSVDAYAAHNAPFERQWCAGDFAKPWICTKKSAYRIWPDAPAHNNQVLRYWLKADGLDRNIAREAHRAGPDAYVTAFTLRELLKRASVDQLIAWSSQPALLPRITFGKHKGQAWKDVPRDYLDWLCRQTDMDADVKFTARHHLTPQ
jgi:exodeoxyribonuclease X